MKINSITPIKYSNKANLQIKTTKSDFKTQNEPQEQLKSVNSCYLYSFGNVSFGAKPEEPEDCLPLVTPLDKLHNNFYMKIGDNLVSQITTSDNNSFPLFIDNKTTNRYLKDKYGNIDSERVNRFISIYKNVLQGNIDKLKNIESYLENTKYDIEANSPIEGVRGNFIEADNKTTQDYDTEYDEYDDYDEYDENSSDVQIKKTNTPREIVASVQSEYAEKLVNRQSIIKEAFKKTILLFEMCKKEQGYDFSEINQYDDCVNKILEVEEYIEGLKQEHEQEENFDDFYIDYDEINDIPLSRRILNASYDKNGVINVDFASALTDIIDSRNEYPAEVENTAELLNKYLEIMPNGLEIIADTLEHFLIFADLDESEKLMNKCFNPYNKGFDTNAIDEIVDFYTATCRLVSEADDDIVIDMDDETELICDYIDAKRDEETGYINEHSKLTPEDFLYDNKDSYDFVRQMFE